MPIGFHLAALPVLEVQRCDLKCLEVRIDSRRFFAIDVVETFGYVLAAMICHKTLYSLGIEMTPTDAQSLCQLLGCLENRVWNRDCGFHEQSIMIVIPRLTVAASASARPPVILQGCGDLDAFQDFVSFDGISLRFRL
jgi:hypothetical protein